MARAIHKVARKINVALIVSVMYACFINLYFLHTSSKRVGWVDEAGPVRLSPPLRAVVVEQNPCLASTHALLVMAPWENVPRTNDPSEAVRALVPLHRMLKRLAQGTVYLAVSLTTFSPSHAVWCERMHGETRGRVSCKLLVVDAATPAAAIDALRREDRCMSTALVVENVAAVDNGLLGRVAAVATGHYACLSPLHYHGRCPVYMMPMNNNASFAFMNRMPDI